MKFAKRGWSGCRSSSRHRGSERRESVPEGGTDPTWTGPGSAGEGVEGLAVVVQVVVGKVRAHFGLQKPREDLAKATEVLGLVARWRSFRHLAEVAFWGFLGSKEARSLGDEGGPSGLQEESPPYLRRRLVAVVLEDRLVLALELA